MTDNVFIYKDNKAIVICPKCEKSKTIDVSEDIGSKYLVRLQPKCSCGYLYIVLLERRKRHRKIVNLPGTFIYSVSKEQVDKGLMTIQDITRAGLCFKLDANTKQKFNIGDNVICTNDYGVEFSLKVTGYYKPEKIDSLYAVGYRYLLDWDCYWMPASEKSLRLDTK